MVTVASASAIFSGVSRGREPCEVAVASSSIFQPASRAVRAAAAAAVACSPTRSAVRFSAATRLPARRSRSATVADPRRRRAADARRSMPGRRRHPARAPRRAGDVVLATLGGRVRLHQPGERCAQGVVQGAVGRPLQPIDASLRGVEGHGVKFSECFELPGGGGGEARRLRARGTRKLGVTRRHVRLAAGRGGAHPPAPNLNLPRLNAATIRSPSSSCLRPPAPAADPRSSVTPRSLPAGTSLADLRSASCAR